MINKRSNVSCFIYRLLQQNVADCVLASDFFFLKKFSHFAVRKKCQQLQQIWIFITKNQLLTCFYTLKLKFVWYVKDNLTRKKTK